MNLDLAACPQGWVLLARVMKASTSDNSIPHLAFVPSLDAAIDKGVCCRLERGALREFAQVEARVAHEEVEAGLARHASCPPLLKAWLAHDAVRQSAPGEDD